LVEGLLHELGVARIDLPPLRGRAEDIPLLAAHFVRTSSRRIKKRVSGVEPGAMNALARYQWPGNVRELQNVLERAVITAEPGEALGLAALPAELRAPG
jgi:DNA-binding NtrC family response regulator